MSETVSDNSEVKLSDYAKVKASQNPKDYIDTELVKYYKANHPSLSNYERSRRHPTYEDALSMVNRAITRDARKATKEARQHKQFEIPCFNFKVPVNKSYGGNHYTPHQSKDVQLNASIYVLDTIDHFKVVKDKNKCYSYLEVSSNSRHFAVQRKQRDPFSKSLLLVFKEEDSKLTTGWIQLIPSGHSKKVSKEEFISNVKNSLNSIVASSNWEKASSLITEGKLVLPCTDNRAYYNITNTLPIACGFSDHNVLSTYTNTRLTLKELQPSLYLLLDKFLEKAYTILNAPRTRAKKSEDS